MSARFGLQVVFNPLPMVVANVYFEMLERLDGLEYAMEDVVQIVTDEIEENFVVQGRPVKWAPLAFSTLMKRSMAQEQRMREEVTTRLEQITETAYQHLEDLIRPEETPDLFSALLEVEVLGRIENYAQQVMRMFAPIDLSAPTQILQWSGVLRDAATSFQYWDISRRGRQVVASLFLGRGTEHLDKFSYSDTDLRVYAAYHLTGTRNMPRRDWGYVSPTAITEMKEALTEWVVEPWWGGWMPPSIEGPDLGSEGPPLTPI